MTQDLYLKAETTKRYEIPLTHLDYEYIRNCSDVKELEKIVKILRSGDEGCYPDLEKQAEDRLHDLDPKSRVLRRDAPVLTHRDLNKSELDTLKADLQDWHSSMETREKVLSSEQNNRDEETEEANADAAQPPVRTGAVISGSKKVKDDTDTKSKSNKKVTPRSYKEWDKFDADEEVEKLEKEEARKKDDGARSAHLKPESILDIVDTKGMTDEEKTMKAIREKDKGNEAFHSHDYEESILYYSRSISVIPLTATYNNRALAYLRQSRWDEAIKDCNHVLQEEPSNIKALLRRGTAMKGKKNWVKAEEDARRVLEIESNNKTAQNLLEEIEQEMKKEAKTRKEKGRRMIIEEVDDSEDENGKGEDMVVEQPSQGKCSHVNGVLPSEKDTQQTVKASEVKDKSATVPVNSSECGGQKEIWVEEEVEQMSEVVNCTKVDVPGEAGTDVLCEAAVNVSVSDKGDVKDQADKQNPICAKTENSQALLSSGLSNVDSSQDQIGQQNNVSEFKEAKEVIMCEDAEKVNHKETSVGEIGEDSKNKEQDPVIDTESANDGLEKKDNCLVKECQRQPILIQKILSKDIAAMKEKGNDLFRAGQFAEAINVYSTVITKLQEAPGQEVNISLMYSNRAACYLKTGDCQASITDATQSLNLVPHMTKPLLRRAFAYEHLEKYRQAYIDYKHVLSLDNSAMLANQGASRCQHVLQKQDGSKWREKLPPLVRVDRWEVPEILDEAAAMSKATQPLHLALPEPTEPLTLHKTGIQESHASTEKTRVASTDEKTAKSPSFEEQFESHKAEGNKQVQKGQYEQAIKCYSKCLDLFNNRPVIYTNRALCFLKMDKVQEAEEDCNAALKLEDNNSKAYYRRALARKIKGQYRESLQDLLKLLQLEPSNTAAKREAEIVKGLYKEEYDKLKKESSQKETKRNITQAEKKRTRVQIEEVDDFDDEKETPARESKPNSHPRTLPHTEVSKGSPQLPVSAQPLASEKHIRSKTGNGTKNVGRGKSKASVVKQTGLGLPVTPTPRTTEGKITPYEFIHQWNSLKQTKDIKVYAQLLKQIAPEDLPKVISNNLDGNILQTVIQCAAQDAQTGEVDHAYKVLSYLRQVSRFATVVLFLSNKDKEEVRQILDIVSSHGIYPQEDVASIKKDFGIKCP